VSSLFEEDFNNKISILVLVNEYIQYTSFRAIEDFEKTWKRYIIILREKGLPGIFQVFALSFMEGLVG